MCYPSKFCRKGLIIHLLMFLSLCVIVLAIIVTIILLVAYGKSQWCVETRNMLYTVVRGREPRIPSHFTGTWRVRWRDGCLKEIEVRNGLPHGRYTFWNEEGRKDEEGFYKNGKKDSKWISWYPNGKKEREWLCKDGREHGKVTEWDFHGNLVSVTWKYEDWEVLTLAGNGSDIPSDFTGMWKRRRADGSIKEQVEVGQGVRHGRFITWHEEGPKTSEGFYKDGKPHGKLVLWYTDGRKRNETFYRDGAEHGKVTMWDFHGNLLSVTWKYEGRSVSKEEFERLTASEGNNKEAPGKNKT